MDYDAEFKRLKAFRDKFEPMLEHMLPHFQAHQKAENDIAGMARGERIVGGAEPVLLPARVMMGEKGTVRSFDLDGKPIAEFSGPDALEKLRAAGYSGPIERPQTEGTVTTMLSTPSTLENQPRNSEMPPNKDGAASRSGGSHKLAAR